MRTIPTLLAAAVIAVAPAMLAVPVASADPLPCDGQEQAVAAGNATGACRSCILAHVGISAPCSSPSITYLLPKGYSGGADANGSCWSSSSGTILNPTCRPPCTIREFSGDEFIGVEDNPNRRAGEWCSDG
jgi:hypothetical protein